MHSMNTVYTKTTRVTTNVVVENSSPQTPDKFHRFEAWLRANGAHFEMASIFIHGFSILFLPVVI